MPSVPWIYINGTSKYRDADRTYIHVLFESQVSIGSAVARDSMKKSKEIGKLFFPAFFVLEPFICSSCIAILKFRQGTLDLASVRRVVSIQGK